MQKLLYFCDYLELWETLKNIVEWDDQKIEDPTLSEDTIPHEFSAKKHHVSLRAPIMPLDLGGKASYELHLHPISPTSFARRARFLQMSRNVALCLR